MAKVRTIDASLRSGKMNKKSKEVYRVRNGREFIHTIEKEYVDNPSAAQKFQRSIFGKTNALVNTIMADPEQVKVWRAQMDDYHRALIPEYHGAAMPPKRYKTLRSYIYAIISEQLRSKPSARRRRAKLPVTLPKGVRTHIRAFSDLSAAELYEILKARFRVFVCEQHIHYLDEDNIDLTATHFALRRKGLVIAYARLYRDAEKGVLNVGRMLTIERGKGFAQYLMARIEDYARTQGAHSLRLHAQTHAVPFYEKLGFTAVGDTFIEADIPHQLMTKTL